MGFWINDTLWTAICKETALISFVLYKTGGLGSSCYTNRLLRLLNWGSKDVENSQLKYLLQESPVWYCYRIHPKNLSFILHSLSDIYDTVLTGLKQSYSDSARVLSVLAALEWTNTEITGSSLIIQCPELLACQRLFSSWEKCSKQE